MDASICSERGSQDISTDTKISLELARDLGVHSSWAYKLSEEEYSYCRCCNGILRRNKLLPNVQLDAYACECLLPQSCISSGSRIKLHVAALWTLGHVVASLCRQLRLIVCIQKENN